MVVVSGFVEGMGGEILTILFFCVCCVVVFLSSVLCVVCCLLFVVCCLVFLYCCLIVFIVVVCCYCSCLLLLFVGAGNQPKSTNDDIHKYLTEQRRHKFNNQGLLSITTGPLGGVSSKDGLGKCGWWWEWFRSSVCLVCVKCGVVGVVQ